MGTPRIYKLDPVVVNRIAAGEVIHRPASAIKELLENAIDAKSTNVIVTVNGGGLKMFSIQDDGCGIDRDDLKIVCERFTTSKLKSFEDLQSIETYGFRGEALASITHVARLAIITRNASQQCAFKAQYCDGKMVDKANRPVEAPAPCAARQISDRDIGKQGTKIIVEDLFYNVPTRRRAIKRESEEYAKILDVVSKYAIHCAAKEKGVKGIGFVCKKLKTSAPGVNTNSSMTKLDVIRMLQGPSVANEVIPISGKSNDALKFEFEGYVTNSNYSAKQGTFISFINHRLVSCGSLKRAIESIYHEYLPKGSSPFVYISLVLPAEQVDVNVHPTKREVHFLNEEEIIEKVQEQVLDALKGSNASRTFLTQSSIVESMNMNRVDLEENSDQGGDGDGEEALSIRDQKEALAAKETGSSQEDMEDDKESPDLKKKRAGPGSKRSLSQKAAYRPNKMIRTDSKCQAGSIEVFLSQPPKSARVRAEKPANVSEAKTAKVTEVTVDDSGSESGAESVSPEGQELTSVKGLIGEFEGQADRATSKLLAGSVYVGMVDSTLALVQFKTALYLLDYQELCKELFYQQMLYNFGQARRLRLDSPLPIAALISMALTKRTGGQPSATLLKQKVSKYCKLLFDKRQMIDEYFRMRIRGQAPQSAELVSLPELLEGYHPLASALPLFLVKLCEEAVWDEEEACFRSVSWEIAEFYSQLPLVSSETKEKPNQSTDSSTREYILKNILVPAMRSKLIPPREFTERRKCIVLKVACLENLYKIFERC